MHKRSHNEMNEWANSIRQFFFLSQLLGWIATFLALQIDMWQFTTYNAKYLCVGMEILNLRLLSENNISIRAKLNNWIITKNGIWMLGPPKKTRINNTFHFFFFQTTSRNKNAWHVRYAARDAIKNKWFLAWYWNEYACADKNDQIFIERFYYVALEQPPAESTVADCKRHFCAMLFNTARPNTHTHIYK